MVAVRNGASVVSMSWTAGELSTETSMDNNFVSSGVTFLAASGDSGTGVAYPAASPDVIGVGGTSLSLNASGAYQSETAWSGSGGGLSVYEREPSFQAQFGIPDDARGYRGSPDVSYDGNPGTGYAVYDSVGISGYAGWFQVGGTSAGTPQWAALVAISNSLRVAARKSTLSSTDTTLYHAGEDRDQLRFPRGHAGHQRLVRCHLHRLRRLRLRDRPRHAAGQHHHRRAGRPARNAAGPLPPGRYARSAAAGPGTGHRNPARTYFPWFPATSTRTAVARIRPA